MNGCSFSKMGVKKDQENCGGGVKIEMNCDANGDASGMNFAPGLFSKETISACGLL
jgi:hypothetical protein